MAHTLSKAEKRVAQAAIQKGIDAAFTKGMQAFEQIIKQWKKGKFATDKEAYHELYSTVEDTDKSIAERFDGVSGGKYLHTVAAILADGHITEADLEGFSEDSLKLVKSWAEVMGGFSY